MIRESSVTISSRDDVNKRLKEGYVSSNESYLGKDDIINSILTELG